MLSSSYRDSVEKRLAERGDPRPGPHPSKLIDELIKTSLASLMKAEGFRKSGPNFWKDSGEWIDVLNIQKSHWNDAWEASFYINIGVYWKAFHRDQGSEYKSKFPREYDCTVFSRVQEPETNSWTLRPDSDLNRIGGLFIKTVQRDGFLWFKAMHSREGTLEHLRSQRIEDRFERWLAASSQA
jgi:hypothetical protein